MYPELGEHEDWSLLRTVLHKAGLFFQRASNRYDEFHRQNRRHDVLQIPQKSHDKGFGADQLYILLQRVVLSVPWSSTWRLFQVADTSVYPF